MAGTVDTLRESTSVPDDRKRRAVLAKDKRKALRDVGKKLKKGKKGKY